MEELIALLTELETGTRRLIELLVDRDVVVHLATNQSALHELHPKFEHLSNVGVAVARREAEIAQVARGFDAVCDPATITEVN